MTRLITFAAAAAVVALTAGCATPPPACVTYEMQKDDPVRTAVAVLSPDLAKMIGISGVQVGRTTTGLATVQTTVYNCANVDLVLNVRTRFSGDRGQSEPTSIWKRVFLPANSQETYSESAVSAATKKISIEIDDANRPQIQFAPGMQGAAGASAPASQRY